MVVDQLTDIQQMGTDPGTKDVLEMFIVDWDIVDMNGVSPETIGQLPISVLEAISPHLDSHPLVQTSPATKTD